MISTTDLQFLADLSHEPSLAAVARSLNVSPPAVSQRLSLLERRLGIRLVERSGRGGIILTTDGERLAERAKGVLAELDAIESEIAEARGEVTGHLRIFAPLGFGHRHVGPAVASFRQLHPQITAELTMSDQLGRIPQSAWDIIIHVGALSESSLIAIPIAPNERLLCAAPSYLEQRGVPQTPADLADHTCLAIREDDRDVTLWQFRHNNSGQRKSSFRITPVLSSNDGEVVRDWAAQGLGIVQRSEWNVADDIRSGRLVRLLADYTLRPANVVALVSSRHARAGRIEAFISHFRSIMKPVPWRK